MRATITIAAIGVAAAVWRAGMPVPAPLSPPAPAIAAALPAPAPPAPPQPALPPSATPATPATQRDAAGLAKVVSVEARVRDARRRGQGEQEVHRLRSASLPAAQVEALRRMEEAETNWRQRLEALHAACAANLGCDDARASFTREELARAGAYAAPTLRQ